MSARPLVISRQRIPEALWEAQRATPDEASPVFQVIAAATFVAIAIRRTAEFTLRATYWAAAGRAAFAQRLPADAYELYELSPGDLAPHATAILGVRVAPEPTILRPATRHRSELGSGAVAGHAIESHWELATVRLTSTGAESEMLEVLDLGEVGLHRVEGDTWVTLEPMPGASVRARISQLFRD